MDLKNDELPYMNVDRMTRSVPAIKRLPGSRSLRRRYERTDERMMEMEVAKPFRMLSAYLTVRATTSPPKA